MEQHYPPSPVPADDSLRSVAKPFTAFGQFGPGQLDRRVFDQDRYWVDAYGVGHELVQMSEQYRKNVLAFLRGRAEEFHAGYMLYVAGCVAVDALQGRVSGDLLSMELGVPLVHEMEPNDWLESTPLVRRLLALANQDG